MELNSLSTVILAAILSFIGSTFIFISTNLTDRWLKSFLALGTGTLITISLTHLIPESQKHSEMSIYFVLVSFFSMYFFKHVLSNNVHSCEDTHKSKTSWYGAVAGMIIHGFFDGVAMTLGFEAGQTLGLLVFLVIFFHRISDGLTISSITFLQTKSSKISLWMGLFLALSTVLGAFSVVVISKFLSLEAFLGVGFAISAGVFLYIAVFDLFPLINNEKYKSYPLLVLTGMLLTIGSHGLLH